MHPRRLIAIAALAVVLAATSAPVSADSDPVSVVRDRKAWMAGGYRAASWQRLARLDPRLRAAVEQARYAVRLDGDVASGPAASIRSPRVHTAINPAQGLRARWRSAGVELEPNRGTAAPWRWRMELAAVARGDRRVAVPAGTATGSGTRVDLDHGAVAQWYVNTPRGIEQGFVVERAPEPAGTAPLELVLAVSGDLTPRMAAAGDAIEFRSPDGTVLGYRDLHAWDAGGRPLPARMVAGATEVRLVVDDRGAAYPITVDPIVYTVSTLNAPGGLPDDAFGWSVAIDGPIAVVGAPQRASGGEFRGSAFIFVRQGAGWQLAAELTAAAGADFDFFGTAVAVSGNTIVVGAPGTAHRAGAAYVFQQSGGTWLQRAKLSATDGAAFDFFGWAVAIAGDAIVVGAPDHNPGNKPLAGAAYVFQQSGSTWVQRKKLLAQLPTEDDAFGYSVAITPGPAAKKTIVVGAPVFRDTEAGPRTGRAFVFTGNGATWTRQGTLVPGDGAAGDVFGFSVSVSGNTAVVGAPGHDTDGKPDSGQAYVFERSGAKWVEHARLKISDGRAGDLFGDTVFVEGATVVVAASCAPGNFPEFCGAIGQAYVFANGAQGWVEQAKLLPTALNPFQSFGFSVGMSGGVILSGAPFHAPEVPAGPAYVFSPVPPDAVAWLWLGLKNSDDVGLRVDLEVRVTLDGETVVAGQITNVDTGSSGFNNAILHRVPLSRPSESAPVVHSCAATAGCEVTVGVRTSCSGTGTHTNGTPRLWYNGREATSRVEMAEPSFLRTRFELQQTPGVTRLSVDRFVDDRQSCPNREFQVLGRWSAK